MSYEAVQWAMDVAPMLRTSSGKPDTTTRAVLIARAERADKDGKDSHAAISDVVWRTGYDERTVQRAERRLEEAGLLVKAGVTTWGTTRWDLDMSKERDESERAELEAELAEKRAAHAERERSRRASKKAAKSDAEPASHGGSKPVDSEMRAEFKSARADSEYARADSASERAYSVPPEPPLNHPGTTPEPPSGGTLPPDPLRPAAPTGQRNETQSETSSTGAQPQRADTATHDRAREAQPPAVEADSPNNVIDIQDRLSAALADPQPAPTKTRTGKGFGFCMACHADGGRVTVAADPEHGDACTLHLRAARSPA